MICHLDRLDPMRAAHRGCSIMMRALRVVVIRLETWAIATSGVLTTDRPFFRGCSLSLCNCNRHLQGSKVILNYWVIIIWLHRQFRMFSLDGIFTRSNELIWWWGTLATSRCHKFVAFLGSRLPRRTLTLYSALPLLVCGHLFLELTPAFRSFPYLQSRDTPGGTQLYPALVRNFL